MGELLDLFDKTAERVRQEDAQYDMGSAQGIVDASDGNLSGFTSEAGTDEDGAEYRRTTFHRAQRNMNLAAGMNPEAEAAAVRASRETGMPVSATREWDNQQLKKPDLDTLSPKTVKFLGDDLSNAAVSKDDVEAVDAVVQTADYASMSLKDRRESMQEQIKAEGYTPSQLADLKKNGYTPVTDGKDGKFTKEIGGLQATFTWPQMDSWYTNPEEAQGLEEQRKAYDDLIRDQFDNVRGSAWFVNASPETQAEYIQRLDKEIAVMRGLWGLYGEQWQDFNDEELAAAVQQTGEALGIDNVSDISVNRLRPAGVGLSTTDWADLVNFFGIQDMYKRFTGLRPEELDLIHKNPLGFPLMDRMDLVDELEKQAKELRGRSGWNKGTEMTITSLRFATELAAAGGGALESVAETISTQGLKGIPSALAKLFGGMAKLIPGRTMQAAEEAIERTEPEITQIIQDGQVLPGLTEDETDKLATRFFNAVLSNYIEDVSEGVGAFVPVSKLLGSAFKLIPARVRNAAFASAVKGAVDRLAKTKGAQWAKKFATASGFSGIPEEDLEEIMGDAARFVVTQLSELIGTELGDLGQDTVFNGWDAETERLIQLAATGIIMQGVPRAVAAPYDIYKTKQFRTAQKAIKERVDAATTMGKRSPEIMEHLLRRYTGMTDVAYLTPEAAEALYQSMPETMDAVGVTKELIGEAETKERLVPVSMARVHTHASAEEVNAMLESLIPDPKNLLTPGEADKILPADVSRKVSDASAEAEKARGEFAEALERSMKQLEDAGRSKTEIRAFERIFSNLSSYLGEHNTDGKTAADILNNLTIKSISEPEFLKELAGDGPLHQAARSFVDSIAAAAAQEIDSGETSRPQVAAGFRKIEFTPGTTNLDLGGGKYDYGTEYLKEKGVTNLVYDPVNRSSDTNRAIFEAIRDGGVDTVTCNNVLNVIKEAGARSNVILQAAKALKPGGTAYFTVYEGAPENTGKGGRATKAGWQENRKTATYVDEVKEHFADVTLKNGVIIAKSPLTEGKVSAWFNEGFGGAPVLFQVSPVWTGSAAEYSQPSLQYVGSGEGAQVYGYGLYGSRSRRVAEWYAREDFKRKSRPNGVKFRGKEVVGPLGLYEAFEHIEEKEDATMHRQALMRIKMYAEQAPEYSFADIIELVKENPVTRWGDESFQEKWEKVVDEVSQDVELVPGSSAGRNLYKQTFWPDKEENLLNWDHFVSEEQAEKVARGIFDQMEEEDIERFTVQMAGIGSNSPMNPLYDLSVSTDPVAEDGSQRIFLTRGTENGHSITISSDGTILRNAWDDSLTGQYLSALVGESAANYILEHRNDEPYQSFVYHPSQQDYVEVMVSELSALTGQELYGELEDFFGTPKEASEFLYKTGIDGVTYIGDSSGVRNYVAFSDKDIRVDEHIKFQTGHRGAMTMDDDWKATIALFEGAADGSTAIHETAHYVFDMMEHFVESGLADERMKSDYQKLTEWATLTPEQAAKGYENYLHGLKADEKPLSPEQWQYTEEKERLARGFEAYCMEGRAPSVELQGAFATLRRILLHIYKTVRALGVKLTDDVRQVFDGMLATETTLMRDSILLEAAEQIDKELLGLSQAEVKTFRELIQKSNEQAVAEMTAEKNAKLKELRKQWRAEAKALMDGDPVYNVWYAVQKEGKMDYLALEEIAGEYIAQRLKDMGLATKPGRRTKDGKYPNAKSGKHPATMAAQAGFDSVEDMIDQLLASKSPQDFTAEYMADEERKFNAEFEMSEKAQSVQASIEALEKLSEMLAVKGGQVGYRFRRALLKQQAIEELNKMAVSHIVSDKKLIADCRMNARALTKAANEGDFKTAFERAKALRFNLEVLRLKGDARKAVEDTVSLLKKGRHAKKGTIYGDHQDALTDLSVRFGFTRTVPKAPLQHTVASVVAEFNEEAAANGDLPLEVPEWMLTRGMDYRAMTFGQFQELANLAEFLYGEGKELVSARNETFRNSVKQAVEGTVAELKDQKHKYTRSQNFIVKGWRGMVNWGTKLRNIVGMAVNWNPDSTLQKLYDEMAFAESEQTQIMADPMRKCTEALDALYKSTHGLDFTSLADIPFPQDVKAEGYRKWDAEKLVAACLNMGTLKNRQRLLDGYEWGENGEEYASRLASMLTAEDWANIQKIWDAMATLTPRTAQTFKEEYHYDLKLEEAAPFTVKTSDEQEIEVAGGYYPLEYLYHKNTVVDDRAEALKNAPRFRRASFTFERNEGVTDPLSLSLNLVFTHIFDASHYISHRHTMRKVLRVINDRAFRSHFQQTQGFERYSALKALVENVAAPGAALKGMTSGFENWGRSVVTAYALWASPSVVAMQLSSISYGLDELGGYYLEAAAENMAHPVDTYHFVMEHSGMMRDRVNLKDLDLKARANEFKQNMATRIRETVKQIGYSPMRFVDLAVAIPAWKAAYDKALDEGKSDSQAVAAADEFVAKTQGATRAIDMSPLQLKAYGRGLTVFFSAVSAGSTMATRTINRIFGGNLTPGEAAYSATMNIILPLFFSCLIRYAIAGAGAGDDPDKARRAFLRELITNPFQGIPLIRDVADFAANRTVGKSKYAQRTVFENTSLRGASDLVVTAFDGVEAAFEENPDRAMYKLADAVGTLFQVPVVRVYERLRQMLVDWTGDEKILPDIDEETKHKKSNKKRRRH